MLTTAFEIGDTYPEYEDVLYAFHRAPVTFSRTEFVEILNRGGIPTQGHDRMLELLLWFGFVGVTDNSESDARYAYQVRYNLRLLVKTLEKRGARLVIHRAFRDALETRE